MISSSNAVRYFSLFRRHLGRRLYVVSVLTLLAATTEGLGIALLLPVLSLLGVTGGGADGASGSPLEGAVRAVVTTLGIEGSMAGLLAFVSVVFLVKGILKFSEGAYKSHLRAALLQTVQSRLFEAYSMMEYRYYSRYNAGHFTNIITVQTPRVAMAFERYSRFLAALITVIAYFTFAFLISWPFASMATGAGIVMLLVFRHLTERVRRWSRQGAQEQGTLNHFLVQTLQGYKYLAATAQLGHLRATVLRTIGRVSSVERRKEIAWSFTESVQEPLAVAVLVLIIVVQVAVLDQALAPVLVGLVLIHRCMQQLVQVQGQFQAMMQEIGSLDLVEAELGRLAQHQQPTGPVTLAPLARGLRLEGVSFAYDPGRPVLHDITLQIPANSTVALVGESGSGKTTLADLFTLILRPQTGSLTVDGVAHGDIDVHSWRRQVGYVAQDTVVFDDTVANNICLWQGDYGSNPDVRRRVERAASLAGATTFIEALPDGFMTAVGDRGVRLSGGQRQRLFIARELFREPRLLILDEATSALDSESELVVKETVDRLRGTTTVVIIAHRLSTIRNADYIYVLERGRIIEQGTYEDLALSAAGVFTRMVALQQL